MKPAVPECDLHAAGRDDGDVPEASVPDHRGQHVRTHGANEHIRLKH